MPRAWFALVFSSALVSTAYIAAAQCPVDWLPSSALPGANGNIRSMFAWDPDGAGPRAPLLIVGGEFTAIGDTAANRIAAWDGNHWYPFGPGFDDWVTAIGTYNGELIAGGSFLHAGPTPVNRIARWDGLEWQPLSGGISTAFSFAYVWALAQFGGELIAGGTFNLANGTPASNIARWDGLQWHTLGTGLNGGCYALSVLNGELIAGGQFNQAGNQTAERMAGWNGTTWRALGIGIGGGGSPAIRGMTHFNGGLAVCGDFQLAGGAPANGVAFWNGQSWSGFGGGGSTFNYTITTWNGQLILNSAWQWTNNTWEPLSNQFADNDPFASAAFQGMLVSGGRFERIGAQPLPRIARFDGAGWQPIARGVEYSIESMLVRADDVIVGGQFESAPDGSAAHNVVRWDGATWTPLADGLPGIPFGLTEFNGQIVAASDRIRRWDGNSWQALNTTQNGAAFAIAVFDDELIVAGNFLEFEGLFPNRIVRWNGTEWRPLGSGIQGEEVYSLTTHNGELIVGGDFWNAGGVSAESVAAWNGSSWRNLGAGLFSPEDPVQALIEFEGELIAGGYFTDSVKRWTGTSWSTVGSGISRPVQTLTVHDGALHAGGLPNWPSGPGGIYRWDGATWTLLGGGVDSDVRALASFNHELLVGGTFSIAGNRSAGRFARWGPFLAGDLDQDHDTDLQDLANLLAAYGACPLDANYNRQAGLLAGDACVYLEDLAMLLSTFGRSCD